MPKLTNARPKYRKHRPSGQAVVTLDGRDHYLGPHGSEASLAAYDRLTGEWLANGRSTDVSPPEDCSVGALSTSLVVAQLVDAKPSRVTAGVRASLS